MSRLPGSMPPLNRACMAPRLAPGAPDSPDPRGAWHRTASVRRAVLLMLIAAQTALAAYFMTGVLPYDGREPLEMAVLGLFTILFAWVSAGFWTAMAGFVVLLAGGDRHAISRTAAASGPIDPAARTAVIMPICNENVRRVFAGLRATYQSVERSGALAHFDFFVLSDSTDPDTRVAEASAWLELCQVLRASGRLFYRWRQHRIKKKSGNVADFCRRWGRNYRYMVVLDADSVMSGDCLTALVRLMEANAGAGIIQTAPRAAGRETLYARVQQFAGRVYGPLFTAGMHYWQLGEAHYWGHNAIIRVAPFMRHCALGRLPGNGVLSGEILSHDFVEAALMRRAGWAVWIAYDLPGSYEEMPPNLLDELKRDQRWCRGNLINARLIHAQGLHPAHRAVLMTGVMAYLAAPLWLLFLLLSTALLAVHVLVPPSYFVQPRQLFPVWPHWELAWAVGLLSATALLLFLPKVLGVALVLIQGPDRYGGRLRLAASAMLEILLSALLAPVRMLFHSQFVLSALTGIAVHWKSPPREDSETTWEQAWRRHGWQTLLALVWAVGVYALDPSFLRWLLPVVGALLVAIPISMYTSRVSLGRRLGESGIFLTPEETSVPAELAEAAMTLRRRRRYSGFIEAVVDPQTNALMCAMRPTRMRQPSAVDAQRLELVQRARREGPQRLSASERMRLLSDPLALSRLHGEIWSAFPVHEAWRQQANALHAGDRRRKPFAGGAAARPAIA
jgi:membrane glycosyltransferase